MSCTYNICICITYIFNTRQISCLFYMSCLFYILFYIIYSILEKCWVNCVPATNWCEVQSLVFLSLMVPLGRAAGYLNLGFGVYLIKTYCLFILLTSRMCYRLGYSTWIYVLFGL